MGKMEFGMPTLIELEGIEANVALCKELGLQFIELNMNLPEFQVDKMDVEKLVRLADENELYYTLHLPENFDVAVFSDGIRAAWLDEFERTVTIAKRLNAKVINFHMSEGVHFKLPEQMVFLYEKYSEIYRRHILEFGRRASALLLNEEIALTIENTGIFHLEHICDATTSLLEACGMGLTWDIGHDHSSNGRDDLYMRKNREGIVHMHIHDAIGSKNHLALYSGEIDLDRRIDFACEKGCRCVVEAKSVEALRASAEELRHRHFLK